MKDTASVDTAVSTQGRDTASNTGDKRAAPLDTVKCSGSAGGADGYCEMQRLEWSGTKDTASVDTAVSKQGRDTNGG